MERLFGAIPAVLNSLGSSVETDVAMVFAAWKSCAGELLSERTAALEFFEDRLIVAVADETWRRHLEHLSPQMIAKLNNRLGQGSVSFIEFVIDRAAVRNIPGKNTAMAEPPSVDASLADASFAIADETLRKHFIDAAAAYLDRQKQPK